MTAVVISNARYVLGEVAGGGVAGLGALGSSHSPVGPKAFGLDHCRVMAEVDECGANVLDERVSVHRRSTGVEPAVTNQPRRAVLGIHRYRYAPRPLG